MTTPTQEQVDSARKEAEKVYTKYAILKDAYLKAEKEYLEKLNIFKKLDYSLAEIDGRLKKLPPASEGRKTQKQPELTLEQVTAIAKKLGFDLTIESEDEIKDLVDETINEEEEQSNE